MIDSKLPGKKIKLLITSIGSLVGQNILDVLDYHEFYRRDMVTVIGTNSIASSPNNYRCDKCYLMPNTSTQEFKEKIINLLEAEKPDLILSGRDEDTELLANIIHDNPDLNSKLPYGKPHTLSIALNKWKTWEFCVKYNLPFADSYLVGDTKDKIGLENFVSKHSYPLIAKPVEGFASKGVFYLKNMDDVNEILNYQNYLIQEYLGDGNLLSTYFKKMSGPTPLFAHAPNIYHHSCHVVIAPDGTQSPVFISRNEHDSGVTVGFQKVNDDELELLTKKFAAALYAEGGFGPMTVQFRKDKNQKWKAQEINLRTNGNTYPRFLLGQDDIGLIVNSVLPGNDFPICTPTYDINEIIIGKSLRSDIMMRNDLATMNDKKIWIHQ